VIGSSDRPPIIDQGLRSLMIFWGAVRPKNHQTALGFRTKCVSPITIVCGRCIAAATNDIWVLQSDLILDQME
jgi:hypothetical protein